MYSRTWASSLRYWDSRLFWASTLFYSLGTGMEHVAVGWLVFDITDSAFLVGVTAAARMAPLFFLGTCSWVSNFRFPHRVSSTRVMTFDLSWALMRAAPSKAGMAVFLKRWTSRERSATSCFRSWFSRRGSSVVVLPSWFFRRGSSA